MLTLAASLADKHRVDLFSADQSLKNKVWERLGIDLDRVQIVDNIFDRSQFVIKKWLKTLNYDLIVFLSDGSLPVSLARQNLIHFQQPLKVRLSPLDFFKKRRFAAFVCNSFFTKKYIDASYGVNAEVIYPPVRALKFSGQDEKEPLLLSVGRFTATGRKKQLETVGFFRQLTKELPQWRLVLAGGVLPEDEGYFQAVVKAAAGLKISCLPNSDSNELSRLYGRAAIYWHAAGFGEDEKHRPDNLEHFGISTVEAMSAGAVPVVFGAGGQKEIITDGLDGFFWRTPVDLLNITKKLIQDKNLRQKIAFAGRKKAVNFSEEKFRQHFESLIAKLKHG